MTFTHRESSNPKIPTYYFKERSENPRTKVSNKYSSGEKKYESKWLEKKLYFHNFLS